MLIYSDPIDLTYLTHEALCLYTEGRFLECPKSFGVRIIIYLSIQQQYIIIIMYLFKTK